MSSKSKIRIEEVAKEAGVSSTTVSRVINNIGTVGASNRFKVERAIKQLNFKPNLLARRLAKGRSDAIALVIPRYEGIFFSFYAMQIIRGVGVAAENLKLDLLLHLSSPKEVINTDLLGGVLFADVIFNMEELKTVQKNKVPLVIMNRRLDGSDINYVAIDNFKGAEEAVGYLINLGHRDIAHITGELSTQAALDRVQGYKQALGKHGIDLRDELVVKGDYSRVSARKAIVSLLKLDHPPTAVFAASDDMAQEVMSVIFELKMRVPQDISVIGFDDNPICLYGPVALTTVRQPLVEMAAKSASILYQIMSAKSPAASTRMVLPTELVVRETCCAPRK